jgi:thiol:disulfide interchange protein DsbD
MMRLNLILPAILALFSSADAQSDPPSAQLHTRVSLVADVASVVPGSSFTAGILMNMEKGWHTYWENPGEAGIPTEIRWTLPEGVTAGGILWPVPHKYNESGDVLTYGYADENMLLVPISVAPTVPPGTSLHLHAELTWLECEHICIPGKAAVDLRLPVRTGAPEKANEELFSRTRAQLPAPAGGAPELSIETRFSADALHLTVLPRGGKLRFEEGALPDFYPVLPPELSAGRTTVQREGEGALLTAPLSLYEPLREGAGIGGVLVYALESGARRAVTVEATLPPGFLAASSGAAGAGILDQAFTNVQVQKDDTPIALFFLFAVLGGMLLNVMPCVLPVIALKIFGLVRMAGDEPGRVRRLGWAFGAGIIASFLLLALIVILIQAAGTQVGWGFQFQEPYFVIAMGAVIFAFGLSLFGVFEVGIISTVMFAGVGAALERKAREGGGYGASFAEGVLATFLATPCTAPFLGSALGFAFSQPWYVTVGIFLGAGAGMALPYVLLTMRPAWTRFLPKPGEWMESLKQFMGFLLMGTVLWLLYILGKQLGMEAVIWTTAFLIVVAIACWLVGRYATLSTPRPRFIATWVIAIALVASGYWVFLHSILNLEYALEAVGPTTAAAAPSKDGIPWEPFTVQHLEAKLGEGKPVFIDFTAEWCLTCKVNEKTVLADNDVVEEFRRTGTVPLKADWTNRNPEITSLLAKFGRSGVPLYVLFPGGDPSSPVVLPEVITKGMVLEALRKGARTDPRS